MRLLWVVPRFGAGLVGGAEMLVRGLATRALPEGWRSEIATTCAVNHFTWENELPSGTAEEDGVARPRPGHAGAPRRLALGGRHDLRREPLHVGERAPRGTTDEEGVTVHRFPVGGRDGARYEATPPSRALRARPPTPRSSNGWRTASGRRSCSASSSPRQTTTTSSSSARTSSGRRSGAPRSTRAEARSSPACTTSRTRGSRPFAA